MMSVSWLDNFSFTNKIFLCTNNNNNIKMWNGKFPSTFAFGYNMQCHCLLLHGIDQSYPCTQDTLYGQILTNTFYVEKLCVSWQPLEISKLNKSYQQVHQHHDCALYPFTVASDGSITHRGTCLNRWQWNKGKTFQQRFCSEMAPVYVFAWDTCCTNTHTSGLVQHKLSLVWR